MASLRTLKSSGTWLKKKPLVLGSKHINIICHMKQLRMPWNSRSGTPPADWNWKTCAMCQCLGCEQVWGLMNLEFTLLCPFQVPNCSGPYSYPQIRCWSISHLFFKHRFLPNLDFKQIFQYRNWNGSIKTIPQNKHLQKKTTETSCHNKKRHFSNGSFFQGAVALQPCCQNDLGGLDAPFAVDLGPFWHRTTFWIVDG